MSNNRLNLARNDNNSKRISELLSKGYRNGSIIRVKMKNFLTYDEAEVFPGPR